jgi:hypothetical protein
MTSLPRRVMGEREDEKQCEDRLHAHGRNASVAKGMGALAYMLLPAYFCVITHREILRRETRGVPLSRLDKAREYGISVAGEALKNGVYCYLAMRYLA